MPRATVETLIAYIAEHGCSITAACTALDINRGTGGSWLKQWREKNGPFPWEEPEPVATTGRSPGRVAADVAPRGSESRAQGEEEARNRPDLSDLTAAQAEAVGLLALGRLTYEQVADAVGCDVRTLHRWRKRAAFKRALGEAIALNAEEIRDELLRVGTGAVQVLADIAFDARIDPKERRQAARDVLAFLRPREIKIEHSGRLGVAAALEDEDLDRQLAEAELRLIEGG